MCGKHRIRLATGSENQSAQIVNCIKYHCLIIAHASSGMSTREIARQIEHWKNIMGRLSKRPKSYGKHYSREKKKILDERDTQRLILKASKAGKSARFLQKSPEHGTSIITIQMTLKNCDWLKYAKSKQIPVLKSACIKVRLVRARKLNKIQQNWSHVIFSGEKKNSVDKPDGL